MKQPKDALKVGQEAQRKRRASRKRSKKQKRTKREPKLAEAAEPGAGPGAEAKSPRGEASAAKPKRKLTETARRAEKERKKQAKEKNAARRKAEKALAKQERKAAKALRRAAREARHAAKRARDGKPVKHPVIAVLATLDTKSPEAGYLRERIEALGGRALLVDIGVLGAPGTARHAAPDVTRAEVAAAGGSTLATLLAAPTRQAASPVMIAGATALLRQRLADGTLHAVLGIGGTQGTSNATAVMRALPYGLPKIMVSTVASGDTSAFVDIKDITMMFSVGDLLGLNPLTRKILGNAAGAAVGMAKCGVTLETARTAGSPRTAAHGKDVSDSSPASDVRGARDAATTGDARGRTTPAVKPLIGMSNLGVLTDGALLALDLFAERGYEVLVFHAVGSGGRAMEQLMKEGVIGAVFDYALGELSDELFHGLRAANAERFTVAGSLGLPQVICPGGSEHVGLLVPANTVPERWAGHAYVFHNPIILAPRLSPAEFASVAHEACSRLAHTAGRAAFLMPLRGTSRYGMPGGPLHDPAGDAAFLAELRRSLPASVELVEVDAGAEDETFVRAAVDKLIALIEAPVASG